MGLFLFPFFFFQLFIWLGQVLVVACRVFDLHCGTQDLSRWHGQHVGSSSLTRIEPRPPALGAPS